MTSSSNPSSSKSTLLTSIRRLAPKIKREHIPDAAASHHIVGGVQAPSSSHPKYPDALSDLRMSHESQGAPTDESSSSSRVYCPPLAQPPSPPPKRRVRMSGSRLPSGYRPRPSDIHVTPSSSPTHTSASVPDFSQPEPASIPPPPEISQSSRPIRTRLTRFLHRNHSSHPGAMVVTTSAITHATVTTTTTTTTTPTSSVFSFPSSSSRTTPAPSSTSASSPASSRKHVRFSTQRVREETRVHSLYATVEGAVEKEKGHVVDAIARIGSPWRRNTTPSHEGHKS